MNAYAIKIFITIIAVATVAGITQTAHAGNTTHYKDLSITVKNPDTAKGRVYLVPNEDNDTAYCKISRNPAEGKVEGNFSAWGSSFKVDMLVLPQNGYVLERLCSPKAYAAGDYRSECIEIPGGYPITSSVFTVDSDTLNSTAARPKRAKDAKFTPVKTRTYYAIFVPSKAMTVHNQHAGAIKAAVNAGRHGEAANELAVSGPLNKDDFKYLNWLSQNRGLVRLDLSRADVTVIPDSAFYLSGLYELKLPSKIQAVGKYAFAKSMGLKPVNLPAGITKGVNYITGCRLMRLMGIKDDNAHDDTPNPFDIIFGW